VRAGSVIASVCLSALAVCAGCAADDAPKAEAPSPPFTLKRVAAVDNPGIPGLLPALSSDGSRVAYVALSRRTALSDFPWPGSTADREITGEALALSIFIHEPGRARDERVSGNLTALAPRWAAKGRMLFFTGRSGKGPWAIQRYSVEDGSLAQLTREGVAFLADPSPDGARVAFSAAPDEKSPFALKLLNAESGVVETLREGDGDCLLPRWSPDGETIAFVVLGETASLAVMDVKTRKCRTLVEDVCAPDRSAALNVFDSVAGTFSPDGRYLAFVNLFAGGVQVADLKTDKIETIRPAMIASCWRDAGRGGAALACAADGDRAIGLFAVSVKNWEIAPLVLGKWIPRYWSADGKRLLALAPAEEDAGRLALTQLTFNRPVLKSLD